MTDTPIMTEIVQNAYVTDNLPETCASLFAQFGIGPYVLAEDLVLGNHRYRGTASEPIVLDAAFAQSGDLNIEIIQVKSSGPSAFSDMFGCGTGGMHHVACFCDDYAAERDRLGRLGYPVASEFSIGDGLEICYVDTRPAFGHMVELYPRHELLIGLYGRVRALRDGWDGRQLLIPWL